MQFKCWHEQDFATCSYRASEHIERLAVKAPTKGWVRSKPCLKTSAGAVHECERQKLVLVAQHAALNEFPSAAYEIVRFTGARRAFEEVEGHGGRNRKTCMVPAVSAATRANNELLT